MTKQGKQRKAEAVTLCERCPVATLEDEAPEAGAVVLRAVQVRNDLVLSFGVRLYVTSRSRRGEWWPVTFDHHGLPRCAGPCPKRRFSHSCRHEETASEYLRVQALSRRAA